MAAPTATAPVPLNVLVVEDDRAVADAVALGLTEEGMRVAVARDGLEGADRLASGEWDAVVLDWMLPGVDGFTLLGRFRARDAVTPVLLLTARDAVGDRVLGLRAGADDYLCKPFAFDELVARVRALLRRTAAAETGRVGHLDITADLIARKAWRAGHELTLGGRAFDLLLYFLRHPDELHSRRPARPKPRCAFGRSPAPARSARPARHSHGTRARVPFVRAPRGARPPVTLTNRLSVFFLGALAVVLVGFSAALFVLARGAAYRDVDRRVQGAIDAMTSAVEVKPHGVDWEPDPRGFDLTAHGTDAPVGWGVFDDTGALIARSQSGPAPAFLAPLTGREESEPLRDWRDEQGRLWRVRLKRINAPESYSAARPRRKMATVLLVAGLSTDAADAELRQVGAALAITSCGVWLLAALLARLLCRRALAPVRSMADAARAVRASELASRLPEPPARDELADLATSFNDLLARVQESYERQRAFTSEASHQLRTPLAGILAQTAVALRGSRSEDDYRRVLQIVHDRADDLRLMIEALLFLARADGEAHAPDPEPFDVVEWLRSALARWSDRPGGSDIRFVAPTDGAWVVVAPVFLAPLFDNLLDNALKYRFPGTPVTVSVEAVGAGVALRVSDLGPGIAAEDLTRVFDPFFRGRDAQLRGVPGLGLGLAVARRLASALGGTLSAESELGCGARFTLILPATHPDEE